MLGLSHADWLVMIIYLAATTYFGVMAGRGLAGIADFFMPRRFGKAMMLMHTFGTGTHSDQAVNVAAKTFTNGVSGIWYQWLWLFVSPFYWLIAPVMRRFRAVTTADVFEYRFNRSVAMLFAWVGILQLMVAMGVMLKGSGKVIAACTGNLLSADWAIGVMTVIVVIYGMAGGLAAAIITDFFQGILTIVFSFLLLPLVLHATGGIAGLKASITDPAMFSLVAPAEIGLFYIIIISLNGLIGIVAQPHTMGNCAAGRTEMDGRVGFMFGSFIKRICTVGWTLTGLAAVAYFAGRAMDPEQVFGAVAREFLPRVSHGMLGLFLAALLASVMSSCDSFMIASAALFTENVYRPLRPNRDPKHYLKIGRWATLLVVVGGLMFAYLFPGVLKGLEIFWMIPPMMGIAFWLGLFWRGMTPAGAWASTLAGFAAWWLTTRAWFVAFLGGLSGLEGLKLVILKGGRPEVYLPWQMVFSLAGGVLAGILVSLVTRNIPKERLDNFYDLVATPVQPGEQSEKPCTLPAGTVPVKRRRLFPGTSLEILVPSRVSVLGFLAGLLVALLNIGFVFWLLRR